MRNALAASYSEQFNRELDPETEILVTAGANEGKKTINKAGLKSILTHFGCYKGMFATFAGFLDEGDEVICMEPFFDQYIVRGLVVFNVKHVIDLFSIAQH